MPTVNDIARLLEMPALTTGGGQEVIGASHLVDAGPQHVSVLAADKYGQQYRVTKAAVVLV